MSLTKIKDPNIQLCSHFENRSTNGLYSYNVGKFLNLSLFSFIQHDVVSWN
jgi:hypothetical protein